MSSTAVSLNGESIIEPKNTVFSFDSEKLLNIDQYLSPFLDDINKRHIDYLDKKAVLTSNNKVSLTEFSRDGYQNYGFTIDSKTKSISLTEWAPNAVKMFLIGDFNSWNETSHEMNRVSEYGHFNINVPPVNNKGEDDFAIPHDSKIKLMLVLPSGEKIYRLPTHVERATQPDDDALKLFGPSYEGRFWNPSLKDRYVFKQPRPKRVDDLKIYESHVGIGSIEPKIGTFDNFTENVLPKIIDLGYNCIQLMAIMEHAYYASFGYQITSFYAASSRYGSPEDLKKLIDACHEKNITVLLDIVHSHASKNVSDGLNNFDGSNHHLFHSIESGRGEHPLWDSRLFDYSKYETLKFLLGNIAYYIDEYQFDGFRFDGVTSMLYKHHGSGFGFSGDYHEYFGDNASVDVDAVTYLTLANDLVHEMLENGITIAEDVSGYPGLALPTKLGGVGFDYKLNMAVPDMWIKLLKEVSDENWDMGNIVQNLTNRRYKEKVICYSESHDQALVGDKTLAFWLMDSSMYTEMSILGPLTPVIDRGIALHKMIRLLTQSLGGEGYLNFMGNEFGHPEWLDFPTQRNRQSYQYARRQYNLVDDDLLRYKHLYQFDKAMNKCEDKYKWLNSPQAYVSLKHESDKMIVFERNGLLFIFNFHPQNSYTDYKVGVEVPGKYKVILNSDRVEYGGHNRIDESVEYFTSNQSWCNRSSNLQVYIPSRVALVLAKD
ncbi:alpha-1,4-glucan branching enzyme [Hanseniaspora opuntiae]